jgi:Ca2+-transporting ATPase
MMRAIHTAVPGRARYKVPGLYGAEALKRHIESCLGEQPGIREVCASTTTSNVLVLFQPEMRAETVALLLAHCVAAYHQPSALPPTCIARSGCLATHDTASDTTSSSAVLPASRRAVRRAVTQAEAPPSASWHQMEPDDVLARLQTVRHAGLTSTEAQSRLQTYGPNLTPAAVPRSGWNILLEQFVSLPVALLGVAAGVSLVTGGVADAVVIGSVVVINAVIGYVTESQSEQTIHSLKRLVKPAALALRDGQVCTLSAEE